MGGFAGAQGVQNPLQDRRSQPPHSVKWIRALLLALLTASLFFVLHTKHGDIPPPGRFFNPFGGFWQNNTSSDHLPSALELPGLRENVKIVWDDRRVPHIFARNAHDLFFAQGYCTARDRLWQMDFQVRAAAGRLSEVLGKRTLERDRMNRRIGLNAAAAQLMRNNQKNILMREAVEAYCAGVNAFIDQLDQRHLPLEFKILDYSPERWTGDECALVFSNFSQMLAFSNNDAALTDVRRALGDSLVALLYPDVLPFADPIVPRGTPWQFSPVPRPGTENNIGGGNPRKPGDPSSTRQDLPAEAIPENSKEFLLGSNNWALSGSRTLTGRPILCNDPHLGFSLPSIWYEVQLVSPDLNVYGVSSPGSPGVLIGFNRRIAFGETNAGSDVLDWYKITFRDSSLQEYLYNRQWRPTTRRIEAIKVRGGETVFDTVVHTHHGPVVARPGERLSDQRVPPGCAMRWTALDHTTAIDAFLKIMRAGTYEQFMAALGAFDGPVQNFAYADADNNIALWHNGRLPLRGKDQGKFIRDGTDPADDWPGWVPRAHLPHILNPARGFVSSANQPPADSTYPYYLGWNYAGFERSMRINTRLQSMHQATAQDMMALQNDVVNLRAAKSLPLLIGLIDERALTGDQRAAFNELKSWRYDHTPSLVAPQVFEYWWGEIQAGIWQDDLRHEGADLLQPRADVTLQLLLSDHQNPFIDNHDTRVAESLSEIVRLAFSRAFERLERDFGPYGTNWSWGRSRGTTVRHLGQIPGLGGNKMETGGNYNTINAITRGAGPSWRMVVELGPKPRGWGVYPGGQSGNPGSLFYDSFTETWARGEYFSLVFLEGSDEPNEHLIGATTLKAVQ